MRFVNSWRRAVVLLTLRTVWVPNVNGRSVGRALLTLRTPRTVHFCMNPRRRGRRVQKSTV